MKLAIMQPYFFPYLGYFGLIKHSDRFIIFEIVQFMRHGWIERNRILKVGEGWQYIRAPLAKHSQKTAIKEVRINNNELWQNKILQQLVHYKHRSPYYKEVIGFLENALSFKTDSITELNAHLLAETCKYIGISFCREIFSEMNIAIEKASAADEWAINICKALAADTYINPPGGMDIFDRGKYVRANINLQFLKVNLKPYKQWGGTFEKALSIIDVMMFNKPEEIQAMLDDYQILQ
jgi:hypothetical protein